MADSLYNDKDKIKKDKATSGYTKCIGLFIYQMSRLSTYFQVRQVCMMWTFFAWRTHPLHGDAMSPVQSKARMINESPSEWIILGHGHSLSSPLE